MPDSTESPMYHVTHQGEQREPMSQTQIFDCIQQGTLKHTDLCWREGMAEWEELQVIFADTLAEIPPPLPKRTAAAPPPLPPRQPAASGPPPLPVRQSSGPQPAPASTEGTVRFFYWRLKRSTATTLLILSFVLGFSNTAIRLIQEHFQKIGYSPRPFVKPEIWLPKPEEAPPSAPYVSPTLPPLKPQKTPEVSAVPAAPQPPPPLPSHTQESAPSAESPKAENQPKPSKGLSFKTEEPSDKQETPKLTQDDQGEEAYQRAIIRQLPDKSFGKDGAKWLMIAAEAGHVKAQFLLSQCYYRADGVQRDDLLTVYWLKQAAEADLPTAQRSLGRFYEQGLCGLVKDESIAAAWLRRAEKAE